MAREFFKNLPDTSTPLNASRLNGLLNGNEAMGSIVVDDIRSKNFFDVNKITSTTVNGVTISKNANGGLVLNGTATGQIEFFYVELVSESKIKPGKTYTLSSNALPQDDKLQVFLQNSNSATWVSTIAHINGTINPDTFTVSTLPGTHFKFLILILEGATLNNFVLYPQIEEGSTATNYSEYKKLDTDIYSFDTNLTYNSASPQSFQNAILKNAKLVICNFHSTDGNWDIQTQHLTSGTSFTSMQTITNWYAASNFDSTLGKITFLTKSDNSNFVLNKITVVK